MNNNRYVIQKLTHADKEKKLEVWKNTSISSDKVGDLLNFIAVGYRIFDAKSNRAIKTNLNPKFNK